MRGLIIGCRVNKKPSLINVLTRQVNELRREVRLMRPVVMAAVYQEKSFIAFVNRKWKNATMATEIAVRRYLRSKDKTK